MLVLPLEPLTPPAPPMPPELPLLPEPPPPDMPEPESWPCPLLRLLRQLLNSSLNFLYRSCRHDW